RSPWALLATRCPLSCVSEYRRRSALLCFFFFLVRLPPRSTLFPYHDALPICEKRAANGGDGGRPARGRHYDSAARRWRRSLVQIYAAEDCAELWPGGLLRERRDDGAAADERSDGPGKARDCSARTRRFGRRSGSADFHDGPREGNRGAIAACAGGPADSARRLSRPQSEKRSGFARDLELYQSLYALWTAHGLPRRLREAIGGARPEGAGTLRGNGGGEARSGRAHENPRRVAIL